MTFKDLLNYDVIEFSNKLRDTLIDYSEKLYNTPGEIRQINYSFFEAVVHAENNDKVYSYFKIDNNLIYIDYYCLDGKFVFQLCKACYSLNRVTKRLEEESFELYDNRLGNHFKEDKNRYSLFRQSSIESARIINCLMYYLEEVSFNDKTLITKHKQTFSLDGGQVSKKKKVTKRNVVTIGEVKFITKNDDIISTIKNNISKRVYTMYSWNVMGHYRHLKDGRKIWVKPYVKGNKNIKPTGKIYKT